MQMSASVRSGDLPAWFCSQAGQAISEYCVHLQICMKNNLYTRDLHKDPISRLCSSWINDRAIVPSLCCSYSQNIRHDFDNLGSATYIYIVPEGESEVTDYK